MNLKDAYSILELSSDATPEEAKKRYRELTKKHHPDVSKEPDADAKFKKINEAYQVVSTGKSTDREEMPWRQSVQHNPFGRQVVYNADNIELHTTISFKDSVLSCKKEIKFNRKTKCKDCNGQGEITINNGCDKCGGRGQVVGRQSNMVFIRTCDKCMGRSQTISCKSCNAEGMIDAEASVYVSIPGGIQSGNILRLSGMGNYMGSFGPLDQHTDVHLHVTVTPEPGLSLNGNHVISTLEISLLESLQGCSKIVKTILGDDKIEIKPMSRNKEEVIIPKLGVNRVGDHHVILDVKLPTNVDAIINVLSHKEN